MQGFHIAYIRVSSADQHLDRQKEKLASCRIDKWFEDHASGKNTIRPGFQQMMEFCREGDHLYVASMDRLARNLKDLLETVQKLQRKKVALTFLKENITLSAEKESSPINKLLLSMMGAVAEFERALILERQKEGIEIAKKKGVYKGRKPLSSTVIEQAQKKYRDGVPITRIAKDLGVGRSSLYRHGIRLGGLENESVLRSPESIRNA